MNIFIRPPVELIFVLGGVGVLGVLFAILVLWVRSARPYRPAPAFKRVFVGEDILFDAEDQEGFPFIGPYRVTSIKKLARNEGATIFCKRVKATRKPKEILPIPEEPKGDCPL